MVVPNRLTPTGARRHLGLATWPTLLLCAFLVSCETDPVTPQSRVDLCQRLETTIVTAGGLIQRRVAEAAYSQECIRQSAHEDEEEGLSGRPTKPKAEGGDGEGLGG